MEQDEIKSTIPTENPNAEQDAIRKLLLLRDHINNDRITDNGDVIETLTQLQGLYKELGGYLLTPTAELLPRAMNYFNAHIEDIRALLTRYEVSGETVEAVTQDYGGVLVGQYTFRATPVQMLELLKKIKPFRAWSADKYVLYFGVMKQYAITIELAAKFNDAFRNEGATAETKTAFMDGRYSPTAALCLQSLRNRRYFTVQDFDGVEREQVINWLDNLEAYANVGKYTVYYALATLVLTASTEQLQEINAPELLTVTVEDFGVKTAQEYATRYTDFVRRKVEEMADSVAELLAADTPPQEKEQAKQTVEDWESKANSNDKIRFAQTQLTVLSRDVYGATDGEKATSIIPVTAFIEEYMTKHGLTERISTFVVERAIEGITILKGIKAPRVRDGKYKIETNISEFSRACGYNDANEDEKKQLLTALGVLNNMYVVVWHPTKVKAIKMFSLDEITLAGEGKGELVIEVSAKALQGRQEVINASDFERMKKAGKGQAQSHFNAQILCKGHKRELDLLNEIFGYDEKRDTARFHNATPEQLQQIEDSIAKHLSRDKRTLQKMFDTAQDNGIITYTKRSIGKGKRGVEIYVYEWKRVKPESEILEDQEQAPEEQ